MTAATTTPELTTILSRTELLDGSTLLHLSTDEWWTVHPVNGASRLVGATTVPTATVTRLRGEREEVAG